MMTVNSTEAQQRPDDQRSARRRLIKGSFAAPAALTLCSGSAIAGGSTSCVSAAGASTATDPGPTAATDTWVRIRAFKNVSASGKSSEFITYGQLDLIRPTTGSGIDIKDKDGQTLLSGNALCVFAETDSNGTLNDIVGAVPTDATTDQSGAYYAVLINSSGSIVGISSVTTVTGGAVSNGCWQSFGGAV